MSILRKKSFALVLVIVVILASTLYSVHRSLGAKCQAVTDGFYSGVEYDGYVHKSIYSQLEARVNASMGLITKCSSEEALTNAVAQLRISRQDLSDALEGSSLAAMYAANVSLQSAYDQLITEMDAIGFERDTATATYISTMDNSQYVIDSAGYNEAVWSFRNNTLNVFPTRILAFLARVNAPQLFA